MIHFEEITFKDLKPLVELGFGDDPELIETQQQFKTPLPVTIQRNLENIKNAESVFKFNYYRVKWSKKIIGFTVLSKKEGLLFSFGINIKFRKKEILIQWFRKTSELLGHFFACILWNQNFRAINFLKKQGMSVIDVNEDSCTLVANTINQ